MPQGAASNQERREYDASDCPLREASMRLPTTGILLLGAVALATSASAQTPPAPSTITVRVIVDGAGGVCALAEVASATAPSSSIPVVGNRMLASLNE